mgnify:CR=1 FL=1
MKKTKSLTRGALIAALYVLLTLLASSLGLDKGVIQLRLSESLCILPIVFPEAVPGLFIGCLIANLITGALIPDVIFGSIATLLGALGAYALRRVPQKAVWIATLPTVFSNAIIVPFVLKYAYQVEDLIPFMMMTVGIGEFLAGTVLGTLLYYSLKKTGIFKQ